MLESTPLNRRVQALNLPPPAQTKDGRVAAVTLLDTALASTNLGDEIIMEAVRRELDGLFDDRLTFTVASHEWMGAQSRMVIRRSSLAIAGGTNLLSSRMWFRPNWKLRPWDAALGQRVVLMGVGWYQYQGGPDPYSAWLISSLLSKSWLHSVRESLAAEMLASIGVHNVINTGCPTIWRLTPDACARIPGRKADTVLTTVNSYGGLKNVEADRRMLELLKRAYGSVHLWVQTHSDYEYANSLTDGLTFVSPNLRSLDAALNAPVELDYVGNRLHAGIRALQHGRRAIIVEIDNRAREMGKDFGLPTVARHDFDKLQAMISEPFQIAVRPPLDAIAQWKRQFQTGAPQ
jgi:polysaccharide pyruvyl transferase WcaK-like protein